jgi:hypothetical protein
VSLEAVRSVEYGAAVSTLPVPVVSHAASVTAVPAIIRVARSFFILGPHFKWLTNKNTGPGWGKTCSFGLLYTNDLGLNILILKNIQNFWEYRPLSGITPRA